MISEVLKQFLIMAAQFTRDCVSKRNTIMRKPLQRQKESAKAATGCLPNSLPFKAETNVLTDNLVTCLNFNLLWLVTEFTLACC